VRDWRIYADIAQRPIGTARRLYTEGWLQVSIRSTAQALDATATHLCLSPFPWAPIRSTAAALMFPTPLDLRGNIPTFLHTRAGKLHDVNFLDPFLIEAGTFRVVDRGYRRFTRLTRVDQAGAFFVTRTGRRRQFRHRLSRPTQRNTRVIRDWLIGLTVFYSGQGHAKALRRVRFRNPDKPILTHHFDLPARAISQRNALRWQPDWFFEGSRSTCASTRCTERPTTP
jgi:hypothetical protein